MSDREPCPFCGGSNTTVKFSGKWGYFVSCRCTAVGPSRKTRDAATAAWNTRREPPKGQSNQMTMF